MSNTSMYHSSTMGKALLSFHLVGTASLSPLPGFPTAYVVNLSLLFWEPFSSLFYLVGIPQYSIFSWHLTKLYQIPQISSFWFHWMFPKPLNIPLLLFFIILQFCSFVSFPFSGNCTLIFKINQVFHCDFEFGRLDLDSWRIQLPSWTSLKFCLPQLITISHSCHRVNAKIYSLFRV